MNRGFIKSVLRPLLAFVLSIPAIAQAEPLSVFVSVLPLKTFVEAIGGRHVAVQTLVKAGQNPHAFEPTPRQVAALAEARLYLRIGVPFEDAWLRRMRAINPALRVFDARAGIDLIASAHSHNRHGTEDPSGDPHVWTSPPIVKVMARSIAAALAEADPANAGGYAENYRRYAAALDALDRDIKSLLRHLANRRFMVFHPAWGYFAEAYDLIQIPIEKDGKEPGPRALVALVEEARRENIKTLFVQPQHNRKIAEQIAALIDGRIEVIDPLAPDYLSNMRNFARLIAESNDR